MKPIYKAAAALLMLNELENSRYQSTLREMAKKQVRNYQDSDTTYRAGVDFLTNEPKFRLRSGERSDKRSLEIITALIPHLEEGLQYFMKGT